MKKELKVILEYANENQVELNFDNDGISLWSTGNDGPALKINKIDAGQVEKAVDILQQVRDIGWEVSYGPESAVVDKPQGEWNNE